MKFFKEPLLHFVLAGAILFGAYAWIHRGNTAKSPEAIHITAGDVAWLKETWARQWLRQPSDDELKGLLADYLREELLAREARDLHLDQGDQVVRRRLAQKMTFLLEDTARAAVPTDAELRPVYEAHGKEFEDPARISFSQIYFDASRHPEGALEAARRALVPLRHSGLPARFGDAANFPKEFTDETEPAVAGLFGADFTRAVFHLPVGAWEGPIQSAYGVHLVRVTKVEAARSRPFDDVRAQVVEMWRSEREKQATDAHVAALLQKYDVVVDESVKPLLGPATSAEIRR
jgi:parvulin-like peptidyl-prolyl cis-trans isomerase-like protein